MKYKHYTYDKKGKLLEVRKNWRHICIEECDEIKIIRKILHKLQDLVVELINSMPPTKPPFIKKP